MKATSNEASRDDPALDWCITPWARHLVRVAFIVCLLASGCDLGSGTGSLSGTLFVRACTQNSDYGSAQTPALYDMKPHFFVATPIDDVPGTPHPMNRVDIRVQPEGNRVEEADSMLMDVASSREVAAALDQDIVVGASTNVRATLTLNATCPDAEVEMELDGVVNFSRFGSASPTSVPVDFKIDYGESLTATFHFTVVDRRALVLGGVGAVSTDPTVAGELGGSFDFEVREGRAAQSP